MTLQASEALSREGAEGASVSRRFGWLTVDDRQLFACLHSTQRSHGNLVAVVCNPLGVEYMSGHRSIRHLCDRLADAGIDALRFDYTYAGDSTGGDIARASVRGFVDDIGAAAAAARARTGCARVALIGIGLGATFAALAADKTDVDALVLWNPTVKGRRFNREMRLLSDVLVNDSAAAAGTIDAAGIYLTERLQAEFAEIDLTSGDFSGVGDALLISRDDMKPNTGLVDALKRVRGTELHVSLPGYRSMMDQPTDTVVPDEAFNYLTDWLQQRAADGGSRGAAAAVDASTSATIPAGDHNGVDLTEEAIEFGPDKALFGIASQPAGLASAPKRAFVLLNCGSEHHAGPHRMYTIIARQLAATGVLSFRFDIEGIGDSFTRGNNADNNSYSPVALDDIRAALTELQSRYGCNEFILNGICAGAYHSFLAAARLDEFEIREANLVNPLVFEWNYDDPDDHLVLEARTYKDSMRSPRNWLRLLRGEIDYRRLIRSVSKSAVYRLQSVGRRITGLISRRPKNLVQRDLQQVFAAERRLNLVLSEGDPGLDLLKIQAPGETRRGLKESRISVASLRGANHGLSKKFMQEQLIDWFRDKYRRD